jgi:hypothetical protein
VELIYLKNNAIAVKKSGSAEPKVWQYFPNYFSVPNFQFGTPDQSFSACINGIEHKGVKL